MEKQQTITNEDLEIISTFVKMYKRIKDIHEEYKEKRSYINEGLIKNILFQRQSQKDQEQPIEERYKILKQNIDKQIEKTKDEYDQNRLKRQLEAIETEIDKLKKYIPINEIYNEISHDNLSKYFPEKQEEDINEKPMKIYKGKEEPEEVEEKKYYFKSTATITQLYKFLCEKNVTVDQELLEFYQIFKEPIKAYIKDNYERITTEIKKLDQQIHPQIEMTSSQKIM